MEYSPFLPEGYWTSNLWLGLSQFLPSAALARIVGGQSPECTDFAPRCRFAVASLRQQCRITAEPISSRATLDLDQRSRECLELLFDLMGVRYRVVRRREAPRVHPRQSRRRTDEREHDDEERLITVASTHGGAT